MSTAMVSLGIATAFERRYGVLKRLGSTPLSRGGLLAAKTLNVLAIEALQAVVIVGTGVALGWEMHGSIVLGVLVLLVGTVAFAGIGLLLAGTLRAEATLAAANALFLVLLFLGGMAYPLHKLPDVARDDRARAARRGALRDRCATCSTVRAFPWGRPACSSRGRSCAPVPRRPLLLVGGVAARGCVVGSSDRVPVSEPALGERTEDVRR